jgi:hypothetical protein
MVLPERTQSFTKPTAPSGFTTRQVANILRWGTAAAGAVAAIENLTPELAQQMLEQIPAEAVQEWVEFYQDFASYMSGNSFDNLMGTPTPMLRAAYLQLILDMASQ